MDVFQNRSKNGEQSEFIIEKREIENPNKSLVILEDNPTIEMKYIVRKKKSKDYSMNICTKVNLVVEIGGNNHIIKVEWKGPSKGKK